MLWVESGSDSVDHMNGLKKKKKKRIHVPSISRPFRHRRQCTCKVNGAQQPIVSFRTVTSEGGRQTGRGVHQTIKSPRRAFRAALGV